MRRIFIYTKTFDNLWKTTGLDNEVQIKIENALCENPSCGKVIPGTKGLRKLRWKIPGKGKRGGIRILYVDFPIKSKLYFISLIKKSEKENISQKDKIIINKFIEELENES